jgi:hypothetical protein
MAVKRKLESVGNVQFSVAKKKKYASEYLYSITKEVNDLEDYDEFMEDVRNSENPEKHKDSEDSKDSDGCLN